jgi:hypothetical protein
LTYENASQDENVLYNSCTELVKEDVIDKNEFKRLYRNFKELSFCKNPQLIMRKDDENEEEIHESFIKTWIGKRPVRKVGVRVEFQTIMTEEEEKEGGVLPIPIFHNYGHGGSGWTIHHGSAEHICDLISLCFLFFNRITTNKLNS